MRIIQFNAPVMHLLSDQRISDELRRASLAINSRGLVIKDREGSVGRKATVVELDQAVIIEVDR